MFCPTGQVDFIQFNSPNVQNVPHCTKFSLEREYFRVVMESVHPKFAPFNSKQLFIRPDTVFLPHIRFQLGGGFSYGLLTINIPAVAGLNFC